MDVDFETETLEESLLPSVAIIDLPGFPLLFSACLKIQQKFICSATNENIAFRLYDTY